MAPTFPSQLRPRSVLFDLENTSRDGGTSTNGLTQVIGSLSERWRCTLSGMWVRNTDQVLAWRAFRAAMRGRAGTVLVPAFDGRRANWPQDGLGRSLNPRRVRRAALDGTQFADPEIPAVSRIVATMAAAAARSTTVQIVVAQGRPIRAGQYFSPAPGRLHIVTEEIGANTFRIAPPLRQAVAAGAAGDFMRPTCEMRFATDDEGALELDLLRAGYVSPSFTEAV